MNILPEDIALRIYYNKRHWLHGPPEVRLLGNPGEFGTFIFDFGDEIVKIEVRIPITGRAPLLANARMAVLNFSKYISEDYHPQLFR